MCGDSRTWCSSTAEVGGLTLIVSWCGLVKLSLTSESTIFQSCPVGTVTSWIFASALIGAKRAGHAQGDYPVSVAQVSILGPLAPECCTLPSLAD